MSKKKVVIASDSFKGTLSSLQICELFKKEIEKRDMSGVYLSIADGGEGSIESIAHVLEGKYVKTTVKGLYFQDIDVNFYIDNNNNAYIETASCAGLTIAKEDNNPGVVTTYGLGEQIKEAIDRGCKNIYIFLGASATNDGGVGLAAALGIKFLDSDDKEFIPTGLDLISVKHINNSETIKLLEGINIFALVDVFSPFYGNEGAAYKFAPQKGADPTTVKLLDDGLRHLGEVIKEDLLLDISNIPGAGAAGGLGGGLFAFCDAHISSGISTILNLIDFDDIIANSDLVISGEGKLDKQTLDGKVIDGIAKRCMKMDKPLDLIVGISMIDEKEIKKTYPCIRNIYETNDQHLPFAKVKDNAENDYVKKINILLDNIG